jgi:hypothetical protein
MLDFQLFRLKIYPSRQLLLFEKEKIRLEILKETIYSLPSLELRKGTVWHIGNVTELDKTGLYFRIGRTSTSTIEIYKNGNFIDEQFETAPYTHLVLDINLEICAIAKKPRLSPKISGIANQFVKIIERVRKRQVFSGRI